VLKASDQYLRFVFLTGVTEMPGLSVFSGLNNIMHLTLDDRFADICGYTQKELEDNFKEYIKALAKDENTSYDNTLAKIKHYYDGYTWDGKTEMYNPFSTLNLFKQNIFNMYWFMSGAPNYLISYIKQVKGANLFFSEETVKSNVLMTFNPASIAPIALLFQTGYLTIKNKKGKGSEADYLIDSPNYEVRQALGEHVLLSYVNDMQAMQIIGLKKQFLKAAIDEDEKAFADTVSAVLTHIPYTINNTKNTIESGESFYHAMLTCIMIAMGFDIIAEKITNLGRIDIVWEHENKAFIIELKFVDAYHLKKNAKTGRRTKTKKAHAALAKEMNKSLEAALAQIKDKKYYEPYLLAKKEVILVGLVVSTKAEDVKARFEKL
jgi:hypothetical protein